MRFSFNLRGFEPSINSRWGFLSRPGDFFYCRSRFVAVLCSDKGTNPIECKFHTIIIRHSVGRVKLNVKVGV